jgi:septal ring factor EnvC (AmiA/AmiB activator)
MISSHPKGPTLASLSTSNKSLRESIRKANDRLVESLMKIKDLVDEINELRHGFREKVPRVAKVVGVAHVLDCPF